MVDTIRDKSAVLGLYVNGVSQGVSAQDMRDEVVSIWSMFDGNLRAWQESASSSLDAWSDGKIRIARAGYAGFFGPSYGSPVYPNYAYRAGSILQVGDNLETSDGAASYIGRGNSMVFLSADGEPQEIAKTDSAILHIAAHNSAHLPNMFGQVSWIVKSHSGSGDYVVGYEMDMLNLTTEYGNNIDAGSVIAFLASGNLGYGGLGTSGTSHPATTAYGSTGSGGPNWTYGVYIDGILSTGTAFAMTDAVNSNGGMGAGLSTLGVVGGFVNAAVYLGNRSGAPHMIRWINHGQASYGWQMYQQFDDNFHIEPGVSGGQLFIKNFGNTHNMFQVNTGDPGSGNTAILMSINRAGVVSYDNQVTVGAADSGGAGFRLLRAVN